MALLIKKTGLEEYAPGGTAWIKAMFVGGPGVGKTRLASYFPKPLFVNCERGLAAVADRGVDYVDVRTTAAMRDMLVMMRQESTLPREQRRYETVVIDTFDAHQRNAKDEWVRRNHASEFTGWEAWGWLNSEMNTLLVRLLNLNAHVVVNVHYKDKIVKDSETGRETSEVMPQLQGETADTIFNDFDLVGWMDTEWELVEGRRQRTRYLTFTPTPRLPFLKDRLFVTPDRLPVRFEPEDYTRLFDAVNSRIAELSPSQDMEEIPTAPQELQPFVMPPGSVGGGAMPGIDKATGGQSKVGLKTLDKPTLLLRLRQEGIERTTGGAPIRANTTKSELVAALEAHYAGQATGAKAAPATTPSTATPAAAPAKSPTVKADGVTYDTTTGLDTSQTAPSPGVVEPAGDTAAGITPPDPNADAKRAMELVQEALGGTVVEDTQEAPQQEPAQDAAQEPEQEEGVGTRVPTPEPAAPAPAQTSAAKPDLGACHDCRKDLADEKPDYIKLSWIKYRARLCESCYAARKRPA